MDIGKAIEDLKKERDGKIEAINRQYIGYIKPLEKLKRIKEKYKGKKKFSESEMLEIKSVLCYGNLAYCCRTGKYGKPCPNRDTFLSIIGWSKNDFRNYKNECKKVFEEKIKADPTCKT